MSSKRLEKEKEEEQNTYVNDQIAFTLN